MKSEDLRKLAEACETAADHLDTGTAAAAFPWGTLLSVLITVLQQILPLLGGGTVPPKP